MLVVNSNLAIKDEPNVVELDKAAGTVSETLELHSMDIIEILKYLPHRYPFALIDRVLELRYGESIKAIKNVTINEHFFTGHFPEKPVMPGVLILESLAQAMGIYALKNIEHFKLAKEGASSLHYFARIDEARFFTPVVPGDQLLLEITDIKNRRGIWKALATARVAGKVVCSAYLTLVKTETE